MQTVKGAGAALPSGTPATRTPEREPVPAPIPAYPPHKELVKQGIPLSIVQVNDTIQQAHDAHRNIFGTDPSTGLMYDVVRGVGQGLVKDVHHLFDVPTSRRDAAIRSIPVDHSVLPEPAPAVPPKVQAQLDQLSPKTLNHWKSMGIDPVKLLSMKPEDQDVYTENAIRTSVMRKKDNLVAQQKAMNLGSEFIVFGRAGKQIFGNLKDIPDGIKHLAIAGGQDVNSIASWPAYLLDRAGGIDSKRPDAPTHLLGIGKQILVSTKEDIMHPRERIGYLALDALAILSLGLGSGARLGAAGKAVEKLGEDASVASKAGTFAKTLTKRPYHEPIKLGFGAYQAYVPAFDNTLLYKLQKKVIEGWNDNMARAHAPESMMSLGRHSKIYDVLFSPERWTKRFMDRDMALDFAIESFPAHELARLTTWQARANHYIENVIKGDQSLNEAWKSIKSNDSLAMGKLITAVFTEDPQPMRNWRGYHERAIADAKQNLEQIEGLDKDPREVSAMVKKQTKIIRNHTAHLDALARAEKILDNPTPVQRKIIDHAYAVSDAQEHVKRAFLGFDPEVMANHNSKVAAISRGEHIVEDEHGRAVGIQETGVENDKILADRERKAANRLNKEKRKMDTLERNLAKPSKKTGAVKDRPSLRSALDKQREAVDSATNDVLVARHHRDILGSRTIPLNIYERSAKVDDMETVYHGTAADFDQYNPKKSDKVAGYGQGIYVHASRDYASHYADLQREAGRESVRPRVNIHRINPKTLFDLRSTDRAFIDDAKERIEGELDPRDLAELKSFEEDWSWSDIQNGKQIHDMLTVLGRRLFRAEDEGMSPQELLDHLGTSRGRDSFREAEAAGKAFANDILYRAGYSGLKVDNAGERLIFDPADLHSVWDNSMMEDPRISGLRQGRGTGYISTRTPLRDDEPGRRGMLGRISKGKYGIRKPRTTVYRMDGKTLQLGDNLIDMSALLAEELPRAVKSSLEARKWQGIWDSAISTDDFNRFYPDDDHYMQGVRDIQSVPNHLKQYVGAMERAKVDRKRIEEMDEEGMQKLREWLYPKKEEILKDDPHVRWFDERFFMDTIDKAFWMKFDRLASNVMSPINEPMRFLMIFATPAYMLNTVGSAGVLMAKQGHLAIPNLGRSFGAAKFYGGDVARFMDTLAGSTHAMALETELNKLTVGSRKIAAAWQRATDLYFRRAAVIGRLREANLLDDSMAPEEMLAHLSSPENRAAVRQAAQQARNDMLDFDRMSWPEKATLRHLVFVYAYMRAGSVYSVRWLLEHPVEADILEHVGEDREKEIERMVGKVPDWFMRENYFPIGKDTVLNGVQLNIPDTLNQLAYPLGGFGNIPYESVLDLLGPSGTLGYESVTGQQAGGKAIKKRTGFKPADAFIDMFSQTPPGFMLRDKPKDVKLPPAPVTSGEYDPIASAHSQESAAIHQPTFENIDMWGGWAPVLLRSALPRHPNQAGLAARYWRDLRNEDPEAWANHQLDLVNEMTKRQASALGTDVPQDVKQAVRIVAERELFISEKKKEWEKKYGGTLDKVGDRQLADWTIEFLKTNAYIDDKTARRYNSLLNQAKDDRSTKAIWIGALRMHGTKPWETWVQKADYVDWVNHDGYGQALNSLRQHKLGDYRDSLKADEKTKWGYGRKVLDYHERLFQYEEQMQRAKRGTARAALRADMKDFIERNDKPITVNGHTFPSPVRLLFTKLSPEAQEKKIMAAATTSWASLDGFSKELLGHKVNEEATFGYRNLTQWLDAYQKDNPGKNPPKYLKDGYVNYLEKKLPGFKQDYEFSRQTLAYRLQNVEPIKKSPYADNWSQLLKLANDRAASMKKAGFTKKQIADQWAQYDLPSVQAWINNLPIGFRRELQRWQSNHARFLDGLVK